MKNKLSVLLVLAVILFIALGCSMISSQVQKSVTGEATPAPGSTPDNRSLTEKAIDGATETETTGVPECDEVIKIIADQSQSKDDNYMTRAAKNLIFGQIKKAIKQSVEDNKDNADSKQKMAENCKEYKKQLEVELQKDKDSGKPDEANK